jgi:predicted 3-demethylubiquinone-9 3-methyltransferase (glyoxalase superfamily)
MRGINPFLWFNNQAEEAMNFYLPLFQDTEVLAVSHYGGSVLVANFRLNNQVFLTMNGGPGPTFTPAVSFTVGCETEQEVDDLWGKLAEGGFVMMELGKYPFSEKYGWLADKFGVSWQISLSGQPQSISSSLMYVGKQHGRAEEAITLYRSIFPDSKLDQIHHYGPGENDPEGTVMFASFTLANRPFTAMDSAYDHGFTFTDATSFMIECESQEEVDTYWDALTADGGEPGQCGWLKDKFGVSWQVTPTILGELMQDEDQEKAGRVMQAMMQMSKIEIPELEAAYAGS